MEKQAFDLGIPIIIHTYFQLNQKDQFYDHYPETVWPHPAVLDDEVSSDIHSCA